MSRISALQFSHFTRAGGVTHRVFSRQGGVSQGRFKSLNAGKNTGDDPAAVMENRRRILTVLKADHALYLNQVHGTDILVLKKEDPAGGTSDPGLIHTADGVVTDIPGLALMIQVADCQAVMLYDPEKKVIGNVHSGWRGSVLNIIGLCVDLMVDRFGCQPANILAGISPSLGPCCAEFIHYKQEIPEKMWPYKQPGGDCFDFWALSKDQLMERGIPGSGVEGMATCTRCRQDQFYSYRGDHGTGRFACGLALL